MLDVMPQVIQVSLMAQDQVNSEEAQSVTFPSESNQPDTTKSTVTVAGPSGAARTPETPLTASHPIVQSPTTYNERPTNPHEGTAQNCRKYACSGRMELGPGLSAR